MTEPSAEDLIGSDQPGAECDRVLVADDDPMIRKTLRNWLQAWGYKVTVAEDGAEALQLLEVEAPPQMLIFDWMMPKLTGLELCRRVRERNRIPYQYILVATARDGKQDLVRGLEAGADDYLSKPLDRNELRARLRTGRRILTLQDEQNKAIEKFQEQATHDDLTGMWNRQAIFGLVHRESEIALRARSTIGMMMLDVDSFKRVNDTYGHPVGDEVLREIARRIQRVVRSGDLLGRYGGEEFLVVLPNCGSEEVGHCAGRILNSIAAEPVIVDGISIEITASLGATVWDPALHTGKWALAAADSALYVAKKSGRNQVVFEDPQSALRGSAKDVSASPGLE